VVTPKNTDLHLLIPKDYVGRQVEVLLYATDELKEEKKPAKINASLRGKLNLSDQQHKDFDQYLKDTRNEWNRDI